MITSRKENEKNGADCCMTASTVATSAAACKVCIVVVLLVTAPAIATCACLCCAAGVTQFQESYCADSPEDADALLKRQADALIWPCECCF